MGGVFPNRQEWICMVWPLLKWQGITSRLLSRNNKDQMLIVGLMLCSLLVSSWVPQLYCHCHLTFDLIAVLKSVIRTVRLGTGSNNAASFAA